MSKNYNFVRHLTGIIPLLPIIVYLILTRDMQVLMLLSAALVHECGHLLAALIMGKNVQSFTVGFGGAVIITDSMYLPTYRKLVLLLSGIAANFLLFFALLIFGGSTFFSFANLALALFNLLPIGSLDGGEALFSVLDIIFLPQTAYCIRQTVSLLFILLLWIISVLLLFGGSGNISLLITAALLFTVNFRC